MTNSEPYTQLCNHISKNLMSNDSNLLEEMKELFHVDKLARNQFFVMEGDVSTKLAFITKGMMKLYTIDINGNKWITHFCPENQFCSSYHAFLNQQKSEIYVQAMEDTELLTITFEVYNKLIRHSLEWSNNVRIFTEKLLAEKEKREQVLLKYRGEKRYLWFKKEFSQIEHRIPLKDIASYLGLTAVSLSRIRKKIEKRDTHDGDSPI